MKKLATLALACALAIGSAFAGSVMAAPSDCPALNAQLTPQQLDQVNKLFANYYTTINSARQGLIAKGHELVALLQNPAPDKGKIQAVSRDIGQLRGKLLAARADLQAQLQKQGVAPQVLDLITPNPAPGYNIDNPQPPQPQPGFNQGNPYRSGYGPGYTGYCPYMGGMMGWGAPGWY